MAGQARKHFDYLTTKCSDRMVRGSGAVECGGPCDRRAIALIHPGPAAIRTTTILLFVGWHSLPAMSLPGEVGAWE
jgi:hypothetical protein